MKIVHMYWVVLSQNKTVQSKFKIWIGCFPNFINLKENFKVTNPHKEM